MDLVKILKDCPKGTKLYSPVIGYVTLSNIRNNHPYPIEVAFIDDRGEECTAGFTSDGRFNVNLKNSECMLFPSKECRDWNKFKTEGIKVGDYVIVYGENLGKVTEITSLGYRVQGLSKHFPLNKFFLDESTIKLTKFDAKFLHEFDKVLVRDTDKDYWNVNLFGDFCKTATCRKFSCIASLYSQCIPYNDETKSLLGTDKDCPEFYKIW